MYCVTLETALLKHETKGGQHEQTYHDCRRRIFHGPGCSGPAAFTDRGKQIPFKTNTIVIETEDAPDEAFKRMMDIIQTEGYSIQSSDIELGSIVTSKRIIQHGLLNSDNFEIQLFATVLDGGNNTEIQLRGHWWSP